eukprot:scaffold88437_cov84-Phaeocystis_antarctica.AAC.3
MLWLRLWFAVVAGVPLDPPPHVERLRSCSDTTCSRPPSWIVRLVSESGIVCGTDTRSIGTRERRQRQNANSAKTAPRSTGRGGVAVPRRVTCCASSSVPMATCPTRALHATAACAATSAACAMA